MITQLMELAITMRTWEHINQNSEILDAQQEVDYMPKPYQMQTQKIKNHSDKSVFIQIIYLENLNMQKHTVRTYM